MKLEFRNPKGPTKVLGAGDYWLDNEENPNLCFTGLWSNGEVIALVVGAGEDAFSDFVFENCEEIVGRVNAFDTMVQALVVAERALAHSVNAVNADEQKEAIETVRAALVAADQA